MVGFWGEGKARDRVAVVRRREIVEKMVVSFMLVDFDG